MCLAVPGKIISLSGGALLERQAKVSFGGALKEINMAYVPDAAVGDYVLVHVGFAIQKIDEREAERVYAYLDEMGELEALNPEEPL